MAEQDKWRRIVFIGDSITEFWKGLEATHIALNHPDHFAYIGAFSPAYPMLGPGIDTPDYGAGVTHPASELNSKLRLFWMSNGDNDPVVGPWVTGFRSFLAQQKINYRFVPRKGGHVWSLWREDFAAFSQLLFKDR